MSHDLPYISFSEDDIASITYFHRLTECTALSSTFASPRQQNNCFCRAGSWAKISSNVFTTACKKIQSHKPNTYYQLGPTGRSITIYESQTLFYSAPESYNGKQHLGEKRITLKNLILKEWKETAKMEDICAKSCHRIFCVMWVGMHVCWNGHRHIWGVLDILNRDHLAEIQ